jgi:hypothetical protein
MTKRLTDPNEWDFQEAQTKPPVKGRRAVVSVAFPAEDFQTVSKYAESFGMKISEFIRSAAVERTRPHDSAASVAGGGTACVFVVQTGTASVTKASSASAFVEQPEDALTS